MRYFLIQPTHRKFIKILRDRYKDGTPVILNEEDIEEFKSLFERTSNAFERHIGIYTIILRAKDRPYSELSTPGRFVVLDRNKLNLIEKHFCFAEWRHLDTTIESSIIIPLLRWVLKQKRRHGSRRNNRSGSNREGELL